MTAVLVCDDRHQVRERLAQVMAEVAGIQRTDCVGTGELLARYSSHPADVVLVGIQRGTSTGMDAVGVLVRAHHQVAVIVFGAAGDAAGITAAIGVGAAGFLRWDVSNPAYVIAAVSDAVGSREQNQGPQLTERERRILRCVTDGHTTAEITTELSLSTEIVKAGVRQLYRKLGVGDRAGAVAQAFRCDLIH